MGNVFYKSGSPTVDTMLGEAYDNIAKVASNLDTLDDFNNNVNLETIKTELPTLKQVTQNMSTIIETYNNLDAIKAAPQAAKEAENTITSAVAESNNILSGSNQMLLDTQNTIQETKEVLDEVNESKDSILICASNIGHIRTTSENIDAITTVSEYLDDADASISTPIPDLGEIGTDTPDFSFTGKTPIEIVAAYMDSLLEIHENLESLVKLADDATIPKLLNISSKIESALKETKEQIDSLNNSILLFDEKTENFNKLYLEISKEFIQLKNDIEQRRLEILKELEEPVTEVNASLEEIKKLKEDCVNALISIREVYKLTSEALDDAKESAISAIKKVRDKAMRDLSKSVDRELDRASTDLDSAIEDAITNFNDTADKLIEEKSKKFDEIVQEKVELIDATIEAKLKKVYEQFLEDVQVQLNSIKSEASEIFTKLDSTYNEYYSNITNTGNSILEEITNKITYVYKYKGSVQSLSDLKAFESTAQPGDTYNVINEQGNNYAWTGTKWDSIGAAFIADYGEIQG